MGTLAFSPKSNGALVGAYGGMLHILFIYLNRNIYLMAITSHSEHDINILYTKRDRIEFIYVQNSSQLTPRTDVGYVFCILVTK